MTDTIGSGSSVGSAHNVTEAYSFACMHCGHGWEQSYEIEHHTDTAGRPYVTYLADGAEVPSPLTRPSCRNCDGHLVRIMRSGQVDGASAARWRAARPEHPGGPVLLDGPEHQAAAGAAAERAPHRAHHWSVRNLLHRGHGGSGRL